MAKSNPSKVSGMKRRRGAGRPFVKGDPRAGRPKGVPNKVTQEAREIARALVGERQYLDRLKVRLERNELPPPLEAMLWHYAFGKPREQVELADAQGRPLTFTLKIGDADADV